MAALAVSGWGLSEEQLLVYDEILEAARLGAPATFLLSGGPGSGKTLLGVHLLLGLAAIGKRTVLAVRNNRLSAALKEVLDFRPFGVGGMIKFFSTAPYGKNGVEDSDGQIADVLVCDEGQRLTLASDNVFRRAPLTVVLYDESQMLNIEEGGSRANLVMRSQGAGREANTRLLPTLHRCRGGAAYVEWVEQMLDDPGSYPGSARQWTGEYAFGLVSSPMDLLARLRSCLTGRARVALVASFTRSSGRAKPTKSYDLGLVRIPEVLPQTLWLMDPQKDYVPFWVHGRSNELTHCASIYGSQGFETDYAGLVWGDDLVIRNGEWTVGDPENCFDTAPGVTRLATLMRTRPVEAVRLLKNRYRILLTRGILGTFVYCEDPETQRFLQQFPNS